VSEWEEFAAYAGIIADAKREERERIIDKLMSNLTEFQYFDGQKSHRINPTEHTKDEAESILRNIIKED